MNGSSPSVSSEQASSLDSSAQSSGGQGDVGQHVLPCQTWQLKVTVESTVPFHPPGSVSVSLKITAGGEGYKSEFTRMDGKTSPPVLVKGKDRFTYSVSASSDKWESAGGASVAVSPQVEPFTATVKIKPKKPWAVIKVMDSQTSALLPKFDVGLKLGDGAKKATTDSANASVFTDLMTEESDGRFTTASDATKFGLGSLGHPDEVWEFVSITAE